MFAIGLGLPMQPVGDEGRKRHLAIRRLYPKYGWKECRAGWRGLLERRSASETLLN